MIDVKDRSLIPREKILIRAPSKAKRNVDRKANSNSNSVYRQTSAAVDPAPRMFVAITLYRESQNRKDDEKSRSD